MFLAKSQISNNWFTYINEENTNHRTVITSTLYNRSSRFYFAILFTVNIISTRRCHDYLLS